MSKGLPYRVRQFKDEAGRQAVTMLGPEGIVLPFEKFVLFEALASSKSFETLLAYSYDLSAWFNWLHIQNEQWDKVRYRVLPDYIHWLRHDKKIDDHRVINVTLDAIRSEKTISRMLSSLYVFYDYHIETEFARSIKSWQDVQFAKRKEKRNRSIFTYNERPIRLKAQYPNLVCQAGQGERQKNPMRGLGWGRPRDWPARFGTTREPGGS